MQDSREFANAELRENRDRRDAMLSFITHGETIGTSNFGEGFELRKGTGNRLAPRTDGPSLHRIAEWRVAI